MKCLLDQNCTEFWIFHKNKLYRVLIEVLEIRDMMIL